MIFGVVVVCVFGTAVFGQPWAGSGTAEDPYQIWDACDMQAIGADANYWDAHFVLCADIDLSSTTYTTAIIAPDTNAIEFGFQGTKFTGVFDGNGHTISNFTYSFFDITHNTFNVGIFGYVYGSGSRIKNVGLINPDVSSTGRGVGSLVGQIDYGLVVNCYSHGGGVSGEEKVGGLVGANYQGTVSQCFSTTSVACTFPIGAFGGLAGANKDGLIVNSYARGNVSSTSADNVGGLVGTNNGGEIRNCYSTGSVSGDENVGGLVGINYTGDIYDSFWNKQTSGKSNMCGAELMGDGCDDSYGKWTSAMKTASTFADAGWDFLGEVINGTEDIWRLCVDGTSYPQLNWQFPLSDFVCPDGVTFVDYTVFGAAWLSEAGLANWDPNCDISEPNDNVIDERDLAVFCENWLAGI